MKTLKKYSDVYVLRCVGLALFFSLLPAIAAQLTYQYDSLSRVTNVNYGNGSVISYAYDGAGNRLTYSGVVTNDAVAPNVAISSPTTGATFSTTAPLVTLAGTASDNVGVTLVNWSNDRGGMGAATGTTNWTVMGIALQLGTNVISVTAYDAAGNGGVATLAVTYAAPPAIQIAGVAVASNGTAQLSVAGPVGGGMAIEASTNLVNWTMILTNVIPAGGMRVIDVPILTNQAKMFYRALLLAQGPLVLQPGPADSQDIWTTSVFSNPPNTDGTPNGVTDVKLWVGGWGDTYYAYLKFDLSILPQHATTATVWLYSGPGPHPSTRVGMYLDRVTQSWDAAYATGILRWSEKPTTTNLRTLSAPSGTDTWYSVDITDLYNGWQGGTYPNFGLALRPLGTSDQFNYFKSSRYTDDPTLRPKLVVTP